MKAGKVYLTGAGCGDSGLLTLKAAEALKYCDVVVYDSLVSEELLDYVKDDCEKVYVGKRYGTHAMKQSAINALLIEKAREGKRVVRLKGGDPYVFGRGGEEFLAMQEAGIDCVEIPGISSAIAVPAAAGIPVTHRGIASSVTVVTGTAADEEGDARLHLDFAALARMEGTLVILMGMHHLKEIADGLMAAGKSAETPCAIIMEGTTGRQRCLRAALAKLYAEADRQGFTSPAVIVIGAVAALCLTAGGTGGTKQYLGAAEANTASGRITVGVTGTPHFAEKMTDALRRMSAGRKQEAVQICEKTAQEDAGKCNLPRRSCEVWDMGFMEVCPEKRPLPDMGTYEWLVFTSPNGVRVFFDKMKQERKDLRMLCGKRIATIGPGTAGVLEENGFYADYIPEVYDAAHLADGLVRRIRMQDAACFGEKAEDVRNHHASAILLRAKQGSRILPQIFAKSGLAYSDYPLYDLVVGEQKRAAALGKKPDYIVFGSAFGVRAYFEGMKQNGLTNDVSRYVCIGEQCGEELGRHTQRAYLTAKEASVEAVAACICEDVAELS